MEHTDVAQIAALVGALGAVLVLIPRGAAFPLLAFGLLGAAIGGLALSLVGGDDLTASRHRACRLAGLLCVGNAGWRSPVPQPSCATRPPLQSRSWRRRLSASPSSSGARRRSCCCRSTSSSRRRCSRLRIDRPRGSGRRLRPSSSRCRSRRSSRSPATSFLWTWDERAGAIALAFFVFPFVAGARRVARAPLAGRLPRALLVTLVALGALFAGIGIWQAQTRTLFFARDLEVANAYTSFFRVTSLFKDPSLYGRYLVIPIAVLLVAILVRRGRTVDWIAATACVAFLFWGLYYSYSQSSFVALFVVTFGHRAVGATGAPASSSSPARSWPTIVAAGVAGAATDGRSARDVTSGRSRLVEITFDAFKERPVAGVGDRWPATGERRGSGPTLSEEERIPHDSAHRARGARRRGLRGLSVARRRGRVGARARDAGRPCLRHRAGGCGGGALRPFAVVCRALRGSAHVGSHRARLRRARPRSPAPRGQPKSLLRMPLRPLRGCWHTDRRPAPPGRRFMPKAFASGSSLRSRCSWSPLLRPRRSAWRSPTTQDPPQGALDTDLEGVTVVPRRPRRPRRARAGAPPEPVGDPPLLADVRGRSTPLTRPPGRGRSAFPPGSSRGRAGSARTSSSRPCTATASCTSTASRGRRSRSTPLTGQGPLDSGGSAGRFPRARRSTGRASSSRRRTAPSPHSTGARADRRWQVQTAGKVESSPVVVEGTAFFGSHDGRLFAVRSETGRHPLGVPDRRAHQREPVGLRRPRLRDDVRRLVRLPRPPDRQGGVDDVPEAGRVALRELLCEPVVRRRAALLALARRHGLRARRVERARRLARRRRRARIHDACRRGGARLRRRLRRTPARLPRDERRRALEHAASAAGCSARPSSSARTSSSRRSRSARTRCASRTDRSRGASGSASTRPGSRPSARTSSP